LGRKIMSTNRKTEKTFICRFIDGPSKVLQLTNASENSLKSIEILTVFLKEEGGPSQAHIRFEGVRSMHPGENAILAHRTWINGKPADKDRDQLDRLKVIPGVVSPYVLDISWEDAEGKSRFQRIPLGH
jgi:hypothetical protein